MNIYLSGPMLGYPDLNHEAFNAKAAELRAQGHWVYNPAEYKYEGEFNARRAFSEYCFVLCHIADTIYMLPGHTESVGATAELSLARAIGLEVKGDQCS